MTKNQENKNNMFKGVDAHLDKNAGIVGTITAFAQAAAELKNIISQISEKTGKKQTSTSGKTMTKSDRKDELIDMVMLVASGLTAYANKNKLQEVKAIAAVTESKLERSRDTLVKEKAVQIYKLAQDHIGPLGDFGVTQAMVDELKQKIDEYDASIGSKESGFGERAGAVKSLSELFADGMDLFEDEIDRYALIVSKDHPDFYNEYQSVRVIWDLGVGKKQEDKPQPLNP